MQWDSDEVGALVEYVRLKEITAFLSGRSGSKTSQEVTATKESLQGREKLLPVTIARSDKVVAFYQYMLPRISTRRKIWNASGRYRYPSL